MFSKREISAYEKTFNDCLNTIKVKISAWANKDDVDRIFYPYLSRVLQELEGTFENDVDSIKKKNTAAWVFKILNNGPDAVLSQSPEEAIELYGLLYAPLTGYARLQNENVDTIAQIKNGKLIEDIGKIACLRYLIENAQDIQQERNTSPALPAELTRGWIQAQIKELSVKYIKNPLLPFFMLHNASKVFLNEKEIKTTTHEIKSKFKLLDQNKITFLSSQIAKWLLLHSNLMIYFNLFITLFKETQNSMHYQIDFMGGKVRFSYRSLIKMFFGLSALFLIVDSPLLPVYLLLISFTSLPIRFVCERIKNAYAITDLRLSLTKKLILSMLIGLDIGKDMFLLSKMFGVAQALISIIGIGCGAMLNGGFGGIFCFFAILFTARITAFAFSTLEYLGKRAYAALKSGFSYFSKNKRNEEPVTHFTTNSHSFNINHPALPFYSLIHFSSRGPRHQRDLTYLNDAPTTDEEEMNSRSNYSPR